MPVHYEKQDHVILEPRKRKDGSLGIKATMPNKVLPIHDKEELQAQLEHHAQLLLGETVHNSRHARRRYVEKIRPTLRYYCKKFNVKVPSWLADDSYYTEHLTPGERDDLFGKGTLRICEFRKLNKVNGAGGDKGD